MGEVVQPGTAQLLFPPPPLLPPPLLPPPLPAPAPVVPGNAEEEEGQQCEAAQGKEYFRPSVALGKVIPGINGACQSIDPGAALSRPGCQWAPRSASDAGNSSG